MRLVVWRPAPSGVELGYGSFRASQLILALAVTVGASGRIALGVPTILLRPLALGRVSSTAGSNKVVRTASQVIEYWTPASSRKWVRRQTAAS